MEMEFYSLQLETNAPPHPDCTLLWVLSSRHTVLRRHLNCATASINYTPQSESVCDTKDDYDRVCEAIRLGTALVQERSGRSTPLKCDFEKHAPLLVYNGWPQQCEDFERALSKHQLPYYPRSRVILFHMPQEMQHTGGQFVSMEAYVNTHLPHVLHTPWTIVTSAYHAPRVTRYFTSKHYGCPLLTQRPYCTLHLLDRSFARVGAWIDVQGEMSRIAEYTAKGWLSDSTVAHEDNRPLDTA